MKKKRTNYILAFTIVLCLISSFAIFIYAEIIMKDMIVT